MHHTFTLSTSPVPALLATTSPWWPYFQARSLSTRDYGISLFDQVCGDVGGGFGLTGNRRYALLLSRGPLADKFGPLLIGVADLTLKAHGDPDQAAANKNGGKEPTAFVERFCVVQPWRRGSVGRRFWRLIERDVAENVLGYTLDHQPVLFGLESTFDPKSFRSDLVTTTRTPNPETGGTTESVDYSEVVPRLHGAIDFWRSVGFQPYSFVPASMFGGGVWMRKRVVTEEGQGQTPLEFTLSDTQVRQLLAPSRLVESLLKRDAEQQLKTQLAEHERKEDAIIDGDVDLDVVQRPWGDLSTVEQMVLIHDYLYTLPGGSEELLETSWVDELDQLRQRLVTGRPTGTVHVQYDPEEGLVTGVADIDNRLAKERFRRELEKEQEQLGRSSADEDEEGDEEAEGKEEQSGLSPIGPSSHRRGRSRSRSPLR